MQRRNFTRTTGTLAALGVVGVGTVSANGSALVNATVTQSGAIVATDDDFVVAGQNLTVDSTANAYYQAGNDIYVVYNDGYSGTVAHNDITVNDLSTVGGRAWAIRVEGGMVDVSGNSIVGNHAGTRRLAGVGVVDGATSDVDGNSITNNHRVGVIVRGGGTVANVTNNAIVGPGPKGTPNWADNGVQFDSGAAGILKRNLIADHWYAPNTFVSSGVLALSDDLTVLDNDIRNNDAGVYIFGGSRNNLVRNEIVVDITDPDAAGTLHYGVIEVGDEDNGLRQNTITATGAVGTPSVGVFVFGTNTKLIRNDIDGWNFPIVDAGTDTKLPPPFDPDA